MHNTFTSAVPSPGVMARPLLSVWGTVQHGRLRFFLLTVHVSPETESNPKAWLSEDELHDFCFKDETTNATHIL